MFKHLYRLRANIRFEKPFVFISNEFFTLRLKENSLAHNRFGFVVSKKVDKRAVVRNKSKRIVRSILEKRITDIKPGNDFLFSVKKKIVSKDRESLHHLLETILTKEHLLL